MDTRDQIATAFQAFATDERYRKFLRVLHTRARGKGRLLAWQDVLWRRFQAVEPAAPRDFEAIADTLCICPVHLLRMTLEAVPVVDGRVVFSESELHARDAWFPCANMMAPACGDGTARTILVPVCGACRQALDEWNRSH